MHYNFIKCAKRFITGIDEEELDWQLRTHQCYFDDSGPCCSDSTLLKVFREATFNKVDENVLYGVIEKICMCYCDEIKSAQSLTSIIIPEGTPAIEPYAFRGYTALTSITIPESVTEIGFDAFYECTSLTSIAIPKNLTKIESSVFRGCTGLTSIVIPESVTEIKGGAFNDCTGLTSITIPSSVTEIEYSAFFGCTGLKEITVSSENLLEEVKLPEGVKVIIA